MAHFMRRLHHRSRNRKLHPLAIVGICLGATVLLALLIGNLLNLWLDDEAMGKLTGDTQETPPATEELPDRTVPVVRAYPFALGDSTDSLITEGEQLLNAVSVSINTPDGSVTYQSPVAAYQGLTSASDTDMRDAMQDLTMTVPYVCGVFYPQALDVTDTDLLYAAAASEASLLREFINAGGKEILLVGASFETDDLPYLADYINRLKSFLGNTPVGLAIPLEVAMAEDNWQLLPAIRPMVDFLAVDLQEISDADMETALLNANYYVAQYEMRLLVSETQTQWISAVEATLSDYQIITTAKKEAAQG